jgi:sulfopyruvate decarboxylase TPP-binding subunit
MIIAYNEEAIAAFYSGLRRAKIDFAVFLPDTILDGVEQQLVERREIRTFQCCREDEGIAMAMGSYLTGGRSVVMMEGSGIGLSALVLARGIVQRTPTLLLIGHNSTLGEIYDVHSATRLVAEPVLRALGVPCFVLLEVSQIETVIIEAQHTVEGQRIPVGIFVPHHLVQKPEG